MMNALPIIAIIISLGAIVICFMKKNTTVVTYDVDEETAKEMAVLAAGLKDVTADVTEIKKLVIINK